jgi:two-component system chemotaxis response regulator CheB
MSEEARRTLIVIGGSAGGLKALLALVAGLPRDLPAAVCVVLHRPSDAGDRLAHVIARAGPLAAREAEEGALLEPGTIYVAVPDRHLVVERGTGEAGDTRGSLRLTRGPKENRVRPAVDTLFRSAAVAYGPRVIAVVLSGALDDGTAGLWAVRDRGGLAVAQEPADAVAQSMPASAIAAVGVDHVAPAAALGPLLGRLTGESEVAPPTGRGADDGAPQRRERDGTPSRFACPACEGMLQDVTREEGPLRLRCARGHAVTAASLAESQAEDVEAALGTALHAIEDTAELARRREEVAAGQGLGVLAAQFGAQCVASEAQAAAVRSLMRSAS